MIVDSVSPNPICEPETQGRNVRILLFLHDLLVVSSDPASTSYNSPILSADRLPDDLKATAIGRLGMIRQGWPYFDGWPFPERWVQLAGLGIHYVDEGYGGRPVVMIHGNPAWSYMWRKLIPSVSSSHRALALDLMGFGKSDKPNPTLHDFPHHARIVSDFIQSLGLRNIVLILHDWGAPFALQYVVRNHQNVAGLIIMNTFLTTDFRVPPNVASKITPSIIKDSAVHPENVSEETMKGAAYAERISKMIPGSTLSSLNAGHFVPEDDPDDVEKLVLEFLKDHKL